MQPRNGPIELYILFILCIVLLISDVNAAGDIVTSKSTATVNTTATYLGHFGKEINQSETTFASASVQNTIGNSTTTTVSSGGTVAMPTTVLNSSQISVTPKGSVQTTTPSNVSSYSTPESPTTPTRATVSQVTTKVTSAPKPTQAESPVTSRESSSTDVTKPTTASLYTIITTTTSGFPNDTLVISGGLYDETRVYNPNMTILEEDDELHVDYPAFTSKYSQFKLEFLPEERETTGQASSFTTFQPET
ncbi:uncharacterized protein [Narcine bancroftii]|uniref:uncharacterized protein isoform X3 n=1 Tax=Narcine bancroftii TaxID=1343680 RepID=UPI0038315456